MLVLAVWVVVMVVAVLAMLVPGGLVAGVFVLVVVLCIEFGVVSPGYFVVALVFVCGMLFVFEWWWCVACFEFDLLVVPRVVVLLATGGWF